EQQVGVVARALHPDVVQLVRLVVDLNRRLAQPAAEEPVGAFGDGVLGGVEQGAVVVRPLDRGHALVGVGKQRSGVEVLDVKLVLPHSGNVGGIGQQLRIV